MTLKEMRLSRGWSQTVLADRAGVSQRIVGLIEAGRVPGPTLPTLDKLAGAFEVDLLTVIAAVRAARDLRA